MLRYYSVVFIALSQYFLLGLLLFMDTMRKSHGTHGNGDTPLMSFLTMKEDEQRVVYDRLIKSVKNTGGVTKDVNKYMAYNILSRSFLKEKEVVSR